MMRSNHVAGGEDIEDVILDIAIAYDFPIPDNAFQDAATLNDIADRLWALMPDRARRGGKCGSFVAFYRVKAWLDRAYPDVDWRPNTRFAAVPGFRYDRLQRALAGWDVPGRRVTPMTWTLAALAAAAFGMASGTYLIFSAAVVFVCFVAGLHIWVFRGGRPLAATPGSVARHMAGHNIERLRESGVTLSRKSLHRILETYCDARPEAQIV